MTGGEGTARKWDPLSSAVLWRESLSHLAMLAVGWWSGAGYLGLILILGIELLLLGLVSMAVYPERGIRKHVVSLLWFVFTLAFLGMFIVLTYGEAMKAVPGHVSGATVFALIPRDADLLLWAAIYSAAHMLAMFVHARRSARPRIVWSENVLLNGAATVIAVLLLIPFTPAFASTLLSALQGRVHITVATVDQILIALLVLLHFGSALLLNKLPQSVRHEIADTPYTE